MNAQTRCAKSGEVHIAYQVVGDGPLDLVWIPSLSHHVELNWENPVVARWLERLARVGRLIVFDKRVRGREGRRDRGAHRCPRGRSGGLAELKGIPGEWRLFAVEVGAS